MVYDKDVPLDNYWGFIDGTVLSTSRPNIRQIFSYNYHKRYYALKFQSVVATNGFIANLYGSVEGKRQNSGTQLLRSFKSTSTVLNWSESTSLIHIRGFC